MNPSTIQRTPSWTSVVQAQISSVGLAARPALGVAGVLAAIATLPLIVESLLGGPAVDVTPETAYVLATIAPLLPIAIWKGEYDHRRSYISSLPVDPLGHAFTKLAVGWVWLVFVVAAVFVWMLTLAVFTDGEVGVEQTRVDAGSRSVSALPEDLSSHFTTWRTPAWQWSPHRYRANRHLSRRKCPRACDKPHAALAGRYRRGNRSTRIRSGT